MCIDIIFNNNRKIGYGSDPSGKPDLDKSVFKNRSGSETLQKKSTPE